MRYCPACDDGMQYVSSHDVYHCYGCDQDWTRFMIEEWEKEHPPGGNGGAIDVDYTVSPSTIPITPEEDWNDKAWFDPALNTQGKDTMQDLQRVTDKKEITSSTVFPYQLSDIKYWVVKRRNGELVRYNLSDDAKVKGNDGGKSTALVKNYTSSSNAVSSYYQDWCKHDATVLPVFEAGQTQLFICDAEGARNGKDKFDFIIDGGDVISELYTRPKLGILSGDENLSKSLAKFNLASFTTTRTLKIAWADRKAPLLHPSFWPELAKRVKGRVMTCCQGGHGRSGTSLVCLMMVLNPEYSAYEAICHLRAIHCPRAIESKEQHSYIDEVAEYLGREINSKKVGEVKSFRDAFLALDVKSARPYQDRLEKKK